MSESEPIKSTQLPQDSIVLGEEKLAKQVKQTRVYGLILMVFIGGVSAFGAAEVGPKKGDLLQKTWIRWAKVLAQAQAVEREAWWVLTDQKSKSKPGSFSRLLRAVEKKNTKIKKNKVLSCEQFEFRDENFDPAKSMFKGKLFEACRKPSVLILDFESTKSNALQLTIYPEYQADVYGLGASLFNKKIDFELLWSDQGILLSLKCKSYKRNRNEKEIVELETFEYHKDSKNLLTLKGQVTEGFVSLRKIETQVPLSGAIIVNETELERPVPPGLIQSNLPKPVTHEDTEAPRETLRNEIDGSLKEFSPPAHEGIVRPEEALPPVAPPGISHGENPQIPPVIKQSEPEMIESSDKPVGR